MRNEKCEMKNLMGKPISCPVSHFPFRSYWAFARIAFLQILAYRLRYVTGILTYSVYIAAYSFLWKGIYGPAERLGDFGVGEMMNFVAVGWILRSFYFNNIDREVAGEVRQGRIGAQLLRPVNYPVAKLVGAVGESAFRLVFFTLPIAVVVGAVFGIPLPADGRQALAVLVSVTLSLVLMSGINFLVALASFSLKNVEGLIWAKHVGIQLLSGLLIPLSFFPPAAARVLELLPFAGISQVPVLVYLGKIPDLAVPAALAGQAFWSLLLWGTGIWGWHRAIRRLTIQGG